MGTDITRGGQVSAAVLARLEELERSRAWLARRLGVAPMWLHRRLTGKTSWLVEDLDDLARVLELDAVELVRGASVAEPTDDHEPLGDALEAAPPYGAAGAPTLDEDGEELL